MFFQTDKDPEILQAAHHLFRSVYPKDQITGYYNLASFVTKCRQMHKQWRSSEQGDAVQFLLWLLGNVEASDNLFGFKMVFKDHPEQTVIRTERDTTIRLGPIVPECIEQIDLSTMLSNIKWALANN